MQHVRASSENVVIYIPLQPKVLHPESRDAAYGGYKDGIVVVFPCPVLCGLFLSMAVLASLNYFFNVPQLAWDTLIGLLETL